MKNVFAILLRCIGIGSVAGFIATIPMTLFMLLMQQLLPKWQKYALPPERLTTELAKRAKVGKHMNKSQRVGATLIMHFGYGSNMGMLYAPLSRRVPLPPALKGAIFGLLVWAGSYLGIAPTLELSEAAPKQPLQRNMLMIGAHLVWGTALGITEDMLERAM
jgi:putative membrane protein